MRKCLKKISGLLVKWSKKHSRKNLYEFLESQLLSLKSGMSVLNVGSGGEIAGKINKVLAQNNISVKITSLDISKDRNPDIVGDVCDMPFPDNNFDSVFLMEVLEHVHSPHKAISEIYRVLKPGGILVFSVPFIFPIHDRPYDYFRYTKYGIEMLLRDYSQLYIFERNSFSEAIAVLVSRLIIQESYRNRIFGVLFMISGAFILLPLLNLFIVTDSITTGYAGNASKQISTDAQNV